MAIIRTIRIGTICAALLIGGGFLCVRPALTQEGMVADDLVKQAKQAYKEGNREKAIHEASKVLLLEPYNQEALDLLKEMGLQGGIYGSPSTTLSQINALTREIDTYQHDLDALESQSMSQQQANQHLEEQKRQLREVISQKEEEKQQLIDQSQKLRQVATMKLQEQQGKISGMKEDISQKKTALVSLNADMYEAKAKMLEDRGEIEEKTTALKNVQDKYDDHVKKTDKEIRELKREHQKEVLALEKKKDDLQHEMFIVQQDNNDRVTSFSKALLQKDQELAAERNNVTLKSYELAKAETKISTMSKELDDLREQKQNLSKEAEALQQNIAEAKRELAYRSVDQTPRSEKALVAHIKEQDEQISGLKSRTVEVLNEIKRLKEEGTEKDAERIAELEREKKDLERQIREKEKDLSLYKEEQNILQERVGDYQKRLRIVEGMIRDKDDRILFLEKQLGADVYPDK